MGTEKEFSKVQEEAMALLQHRISKANDTKSPQKEAYSGELVSRRLHKKFGVGQQPVKRWALYKMLDKLHERFGRELEDVITEAVTEAATADAPDRYFCRAVKLKLLARGMTLAPPGASEW